MLFPKFTLKLATLLVSLAVVGKPFDAAYLPWILPSSSLPHYRLNLVPSNYKQLTSGSVQPASLIDNNTSYPVSLRLLPDRSLQVQFTDNYPDTFAELYLSSPQVSHFLLASLTAHRAQKLNLLIPDSWFVTLTFNHGSPSVYFVQEAWNKNFLERHGRSSDSDLFALTDPQRLGDLSAWTKYSRNPLAPNDYAAISQLIDALNQTDADTQLSQLTALIDLESFARWQALTDLGSDNQFLLYFSRDTGLFEFVASYQPAPVAVDNQLVNALLKHPSISSRRRQIVKDYVQQNGQLSEDIRYYDNLFNQLRFAFAKDTVKTYSTYFFASSVFKDRQQLINRFHQL